MAQPSPVRTNSTKNWTDAGFSVSHATSPVASPNADAGRQPGPRQGGGRSAAPPPEARDDPSWESSESGSSESASSSTARGRRVSLVSQFSRLRRTSESRRSSMPDDTAAGVGQGESFSATLVSASTGKAQPVRLRVDVKGVALEESAAAARQPQLIKLFALDQIAGWRHKEGELLLYVVSRKGNSAVQQIAFRTEQGERICSILSAFSEAASGQAAPQRRDSLPQRSRLCVASAPAAMPAAAPPEGTAS